MNKLGFGLMRLPVLDKNDDASVDIELVKKMVDAFIDAGFTYFDTAIMYCGSASQRIAKEVLVDRYTRNSFTLATKLHCAYFNSLEDRDKVFSDQLRQTGAGYFDYYLLHGIEAENYSKFERLDCFSWLLEKKALGLVKHPGFSFHGTPQLLDQILTRHPEMEFVQMQLNYLDWESEWVQARAVHDMAVKHGKPIIVMEPVKGGTLANVPTEAENLLKASNPEMSVPSWAIRFAASQENVMMVLSGMSSLEQVMDNTSYMKNFKPLTEEETSLTRKAAEIINAQIAVPCTSCSYCTEGCPSQIPIPRYFSLYNEDMREDLEEKGWTVNYYHYELLSESFGKASDCIACGQCEGVCPQHLPIIDLMKKVSAHFDH